jgi:hypothetical protein
MKSFVWQIRSIFICMALAGFLVYGFVPGVGVWIIVITVFVMVALAIFETFVRCIVECVPRRTRSLTRTRHDPPLNYIVIFNPGGQVSVGMHTVYIQREQC